MTQMKNQLRVRKQGSTPKPREENASGMGGREFGQVIEPMQAQMASGNEGLAEISTGGGKKSPPKRKKVA